MGKASRRKNKAQSPETLAGAKSFIQNIVGENTEIRVRDNLPQEEKISHALSLLLESEVEPSASINSFEMMLTLIVIAWNVSLLERATRTSKLREHVDNFENMEESVKQDLIQQIEWLIVRKEVLFPKDQRMIVSWDVRKEGSIVRVSAAALTKD